MIHHIPVHSPPPSALYPSVSAELAPGQLPQPCYVTMTAPCLTQQLCSSSRSTYSMFNSPCILMCVLLLSLSYPPSPPQ